jgi:glutathione S-transferase
MIRISAFKSLDPMAQGFTRDVSVRWALEESELSYETVLVSAEERKSESYIQKHPFSQIPAYEDNGINFFESGAIVLHIAEKSVLLLPKESQARASVQSWMFAAMNTIDPVVKNFEQVEYFTPDEEWARLRKAGAIEAAQRRLSQLANHLQNREYLVDQFSAADILMTMSLRNLGPSDLFMMLPAIVTYVQRCEARPAFQKAMAKHMASYS